MDLQGMNSQQANGPMETQTGWQIAAHHTIRISHFHQHMHAATRFKTSNKGQEVFGFIFSLQTIVCFFALLNLNTQRFGGCKSNNLQNLGYVWFEAAHI
jgi:hypothetical protein